jgi:hypothetical protein
MSQAFLQWGAGARIFDRLPSAVLANAQDWVSGTTWLYADVNNYVRLEGVSIASLQANDFVFA